MPEIPRGEMGPQQQNVHEISWAEDPQKDSMGARAARMNMLKQVLGHDAEDSGSAVAEDIKVTFKDGSVQEFQINYDPDAEQGEQWEVHGIGNDSGWSDRW